MGFGPIQFGGLASGLDTDSIITALLAVEALPIQGLESQVSTANKKVDLLGTLDGLLDTLKEKAETVGAESSFYAHTVETGEEGVANVTLTGTPAAGSHTLTVNSLAAAETWTTGGLADSDTTTLTGTVDFTYAGTNVYSIDVTGMTLDQAVAEINSQASDHVQASVVNTGTSSSPSYQLVLTGNDTGSVNQITGLAVPTELGATSELVDASDAQIVLDNLTITRETNVFSDVLGGVQIDALAADVGKTISFTVDVDNEGIKTKIQEMVDAYNAVITFINGQQEYTPGAEGTDEAGETGGVLFGESVLGSVKTAINDALFNVDLATIQADTTGFYTMGLVGIDLAIDGTISIDDTVMDAKMAEDLDAFMDLFVDTDGFDNGGADPWESGHYVDSGTTDSGLADTLARKIDALLSSQETQAGSTIEGLLQARIDGLESNISSWEDQIDDLEDRLADVELTLVNKFTALEELMAGLNAQSQFLSAQLSSPS